MTLLTTNLPRALLFTVIFMFSFTSDNYAHVDEPVAVSGIEVQEAKPLFFQNYVDPENFSEESREYFKEQAILAAKDNDAANAAKFAGLFVKYTGETHFIEYGYFKHLKNTEEFKALHDKYTLNIDALNFFYLFTALIGFFIGFMLLLKGKQNRPSKLLISTFVLIHSLFIFHIFLYQSKLLYSVPHVLYMSSIFSYLYGPLIYFYYKRVTVQYKFSKKDLIHLVPTLLVFAVMLPIFMLPASEKLRVMFEVGIVDREPYRNIITLTKFSSLFLYGFFILRDYLKNKGNWSISDEAQKWIRNLVVLTEIYVLLYLIYAFEVIQVVPRSSWLFNLQIVAMATMVIYIGYTSYVRPNLFSNDFLRVKKKYKKSGLTTSFSLELREQLIKMLEVDKIYRENDISLAIVSDRLGTTRHNTSQVINEHFGLNFFELINKYRIEEALEILKSDTEKTKNIIDVAYEVGFNNKVTFNKSFRKQLDLTPTQYLSSIR